MFQERRFERVSELPLFYQIFNEKLRKSLALRTRSLRSRLGDSATRLSGCVAWVSIGASRSSRASSARLERDRSNRPTSFTLLLADRASVEVSNGPRVLETEAVSQRVPLLALRRNKDVLGNLGDANSDRAHRASLELSNRPCALEPGATTMLVPIGVLGRDKDACLLVDCLLVLRGPLATAPAARAAAALAATHAC